MEPRISILLVDDHILVRGGVRAYLETQADFDVVGEAGDGQEAVRLAAELAPDVVLMDLVMPVMDGVEATHRIRSASPRTQVVVLTSFHEDASIFPAIRAGALSYLLKSAGPEEVASALRRAAQGEATVHPRVAARLMESTRMGGSNGINLFLELTEREQDVLRLIAQAQTNAEIARNLGIGEKTVKGHVSNILAKLALEDRTQAAVFAWKAGFIRHIPGE